MKFSAPLPKFLPLVVLFCLGVQAARGATFEKANNVLALNLGSSWTNGTPPGAADVAQWSAVVAGANTVSLGANANWLGIKLTNPGGAVTLNNDGNTLTLGGSGIDLSAATASLTINCPLTMSAAQTWNVTGAMTLAVNSTVGAGGGGTNLTKSGSGALSLSGGSAGTPSRLGYFYVAAGTVNVGGYLDTLNTGDKFRLYGGSTVNWSATGNSTPSYGFYIADGSAATLNVTGGTLTASPASWLGIGNAATGILSLAGGTFVVGNNVHFILGSGYNNAGNGTGIITNTGGTLDTGTTTGLFQLGNNGGAGTVHLDGGVIATARSITRGVNGAGGTATFNYNGGTLRANGNNSTFMTGLTTANVRNGGAFLDDGGFAVTVGQPLIHSTIGGDNVLDGGLTKFGSGTLTLTATNTYSGSTIVSNGTLTISGRLNGSGGVTVRSGAALRGTGAVAGSVTVQDGGKLGATTNDLAVGTLNLGSGSVLDLALGAANSGTNAAVRVTGNLTLAGLARLTNGGGLTPGSTLAAIHYTGTLVNNGLAVDPLSAWDFTVDVSTPNVVKFQVIGPQPIAGFTNASFAVTSTSTNLGGILRGTPALPLWYEVRDQTNRLWDHGSTPAVSPWGVTVRHLRPGTNTVTVFAKESGGNIASHSIQLTMTLANNPSIRPRPQPAEVWWGGTCHTNVYSGQNIVGAYSRLEQLTNTVGWDFVKRFQDGFMLHGYVWVNDIARMANWVTVGQSISAQLAPYHGKYWLENVWRPRTNDMNYGHASVSGQLTDVNDMLGVGLALSEITQDYNPMWSDFSKWHPAWPTNDIRVAGTGNTNAASPSYPFASGQWRDFASDFRAARPNIQLGWTWSPVYFHWLTGPALADYGVFNVTNGPTVYSFNWDFYDWMNDAALIGSDLGAPFAFASDCPWGWFGAWGNPTAARNNRKKIRDYEAWLQGQSLRHTLICNDATSGTLASNPDLWDLTFKSNSLANLRLHQQEGGRAARYLFESWYEGPFTLLPETKPGSYANLAKEAIQFIKGIADTNGTLEPLALTVLSTGAVTTVRLQNNGSTPCLPAIVAFESGSPTATIQYANAAGSNITAQILSADGYAHANLLQPGQSTTITIAVQNLAAVQSRAVTLEAFWNPQDPGGFVRDRVTIPFPVSFIWTNNASGNWSTAGNWTNNLAPVAGGAENATVRFSGGGYTASNNFAGQFVLNKLELNSATGGTLTGGELRFATPAGGVAAPQLNQNAAGVFAVNNALVLDAEVTLGGTGAGAVNVNGAISGMGGLTKSASATVMLAGSNTFSGITRITSGIIIVGDGTNNSAISTMTTNSATLRFVTATNTTQTHVGTIHGTGALQKQGSGTLILADPNSFDGSVNIGAQNVNGGALRIASGGALGSTAGQTFIGGGTSDARLELLGGITVAESLTLAQNSGAIVHVSNITGTNTITGNVTLNGGGNTWTIQSDAGRLVFTGNFTNSASGFTRPIQLQGDGDGELAGTLADSSLNWLQVRKAGNGTWTLPGNATLPQGVQVSQGTLLLNGTLGIGTNAGNSVVNGGTLGGNGTTLGSIAVNAGGTLTPGANGIGTLTVASNLTFAVGSLCVMEISKAASTNDRVQGLQLVSFGGTLTVTNLAGTLAAGDSFQLFSAANCAGSFASLSLPPLGAGLVWSNRLALDGSLAVVALPVDPPLLAFSLTSSNSLLFNWTNGPASFRLQSQTNALNTGLGTNWFDYPGGTNPPVNVPLDRAPSGWFFRLISP